MAVTGKPDDNHRYVYTMVDKRPQFLIMDKCNFCPFLINDMKNGAALCGKFINPASILEEKNYISKVYGYVQKIYQRNEMNILTQVDIPSWCNLPDHLSEISPNDNINYVKDGKLNVECGQNYSNAVQIIDVNEVQYDLDGEKIILKPKQPTYINYGKDGKRFTSDDSIPANPSESSTAVIDGEVCSMCGEEKEDVNREIRLGMCDDCWSKSKFSHPKRYTAKINNFRLKRKEDWVGEDYKKVIIN